MWDLLTLISLYFSCFKLGAFPKEPLPEISFGVRQENQFTEFTGKGSCGEE